MQIKALLLSAIIVIACQSCTKEKLNDHDTIVGSWNIKKIIGLNGLGNSATLDFATGQYTFKADGSFEYLDGIGILYKGNWSMYETPDQSYTDTDGNFVSDPAETVLKLDAAANNSVSPPQKKSADLTGFTIIDANNFTAYQSSNAGFTFVCSFVRLK